jgi:hypothetical protein
MGQGFVMNRAVIGFEQSGGVVVHVESRLGLNETIKPPHAPEKKVD